MNGVGCHRAFQFETSEEELWLWDGGALLERTGKLEVVVTIREVVGRFQKLNHCEVSKKGKIKRICLYFS